MGSKQADETIKCISINLNETDGFTLSFRRANPWRHKVQGELCLHTSNSAFADVVSGDRISLDLHRDGETLVCMRAVVHFEEWNRIRYEGFTWGLQPQEPYETKPLEEVIGCAL